MEKYIPHRHVCEVRLFRPHSWEVKCPLLGKLSESEDECEECIHFITVNFSPDNELMVSSIIRIRES